ncbi:sugar phosphate isomerase/epimerase [Eubacteriales bacterium OttesenSCG-928-G02]|nr:sugar phosphate isomerase/epimerase [Eubacteriales bacterium OttesenSCG-928-G02]
MQFGMPTLIELKGAESCAALCRELGLAFVELNMNLPEYQTDNFDVARLTQIADKYGIYYTIHLDENLNPCDFNNKVAAAYTETALQTIDIAKQLAVPILNMHLNSGVWFTLPDKKVFLFDEYEQEYIRKLTAFRDVCTVAIGNADIKICVENCGDYGDKPYIQKGLALLLESPVFVLTFDVGHNAAAEYADEPIIMEHIASLSHMHIHDASGRKSHLKLGEGDVDLLKYLDLAKEHNCRAVLEVKTVDGLRQSVNWLKERGYL